VTVKRRVALAGLALGALLGGALAAVAARGPAAGSVAPCPPTGTLVAVRSADHRLRLCRAGRVEGSFRVALGRGGLDKRREGDERTPVGRYALGAPRGSERFHKFVPVGYPTEAQRAEGRTGSAIGVHGPDARFSWLGGATAWVDWTNGCIAVGTRREIDTIAEWVTQAGARTIAID
jgi:L,D-peptidoglycan transpeptidase YkuD (ErfK/YbiS/YcfS/YnhG family)